VDSVGTCPFCSHKDGRHLDNCPRVTAEIAKQQRPARWRNVLPGFHIFEFQDDHTFCVVENPIQTHEGLMIGDVCDIKARVTSRESAEAVVRLLTLCTPW
jgi:hypothetical protein